eukprot:7602746-Lingulodinium_polyedra.AAC.1
MHGGWMSKSSTRKQCLAAYTRCTEEPAVPTCALLHMLLRWATLSPQGGGMADRRNAAAAQVLLSSLVSICSPETEPV